MLFTFFIMQLCLLPRAKSVGCIHSILHAFFIGKDFFIFYSIWDTWTQAGMQNFGIRQKRVPYVKELTVEY